MKKTLIATSLIALVLTSCGANNPSSFDDASSSQLEDSTSEEISSSEDSTFSNEESSSHGYLDDYSLYWEDQFDGNALSSNWEPMIGDGSNYNVYRWGNNEEQYYKRENATVSDGMLHITAKKEVTSYTSEDNQVRTYQFTSARLRTTGKITTTYGYIEARMKLPEGTGMWPAFWMLPEGDFQGKWWPTNGEIDIMEAKGRISNKASSTVHTGTSNGQDYYKYRDYTFPSTEEGIGGFHTYGVDWSLEGFKFFVDGKEFFEVTPQAYQGSNAMYAVSSTAPFDRPFHLLINLAVGGNYDGGRSPDENFTQAEMLVDYVRIYHHN